ncbi:hypothetical protein N0V85_003401 [Neurospora sp. IMI 360204]|nr:hypothetical protein N0V85_003401 [Neurospora sp. IMI 360204]
MLASEAHETASTTDTQNSKPIPSKTVTREGGFGTDITVYNLTLSIHCTECQGPTPKNYEKQNKDCVSEDDTIAAKKPGYFDIADFKTPPPRAVPRNILWMYGLEEFFEPVPAGETPRIKLEGNFCQLAASEEKVKERSDMTVRTLYSNMARGGLDSDLWEYLYNLEDVARSYGEPVVKVMKIDQAKGGDASKKDSQEEDPQSEHQFAVKRWPPRFLREWSPKTSKIEKDLSNREGGNFLQSHNFHHLAVQEHRKIHFFIDILRPHSIEPTKGSKAINDGFYRTGLVSWPKTPLEFPKDSDSDVEPLNSDVAFSLPFQTNPAILTHVQKYGESKPDYQLILTIDVYPDFKKHPVTLTEELEERDGSEDEWDDPEESTNKARL